MCALLFYYNSGFITIQVVTVHTLKNMHDFSEVFFFFKNIRIGFLSCYCMEYHSDLLLYTEFILVRLCRNLLAYRNTVESVPGTNQYWVIYVKCFLKETTACIFMIYLWVSSYYQKRKCHIYTRFLKLNLHVLKNNTYIIVEKK